MSTNNGYPPGAFPPPQTQAPSYPQQQSYPQHQGHAPQQHYSPPQHFGGGGDEFAGLNEADPTGQSLPYFLDGEYLVQIDTLKKVKSRKGDVLIFIEGTILETNNPQRPSGMQCSTNVKLNSDMGPINLKRFMAAAMGVMLDESFKPRPGQPLPPAPDGRPWNVVAGEIVTQEQPWRGRHVRLRALTIEKKRSVGEFTQMSWSPAQRAQPNSVPQAPFNAQPGPQFNPGPQQGQPAPQFNPPAAPPQYPQFPGQPTGFGQVPQGAPNFGPPNFGPPGFNPPRGQ